MPSGAAVETNGLKSWVMLFSGELSITSSLLPLAALASAPDDLGMFMESVGELPDAQAARPAARRPVAMSASALLLAVRLVITVDLTLIGTTQGEPTAKRVNEPSMSTIVNMTVLLREKRKARPRVNGRAFTVMAREVTR